MSYSASCASCALNRPFAASSSRGTKPPRWRAKVALGQDKQKTYTGEYIIVNGNFLCLSCPSATFALQHGGFVPREWPAAKGRSVQVLPVFLPSSPGERRGACVTQAGDKFESHAWNTTFYNRLTGPYKPTLCFSKTLFNSIQCSSRKTLSWNEKHNLFNKQAFLMQWCHGDNTVKNDSNEHIIIH